MDVDNSSPFDAGGARNYTREYANLREVGIVGPLCSSGAGNSAALRSIRGGINGDVTDEFPCSASVYSGKRILPTRFPRIPKNLPAKDVQTIEPRILL